MLLGIGALGVVQRGFPVHHAVNDLKWWALIPEPCASLASGQTVKEPKTWL